MTIAQHVSAGIKSRFRNESVKRTTEIEDFSRTSDSAFAVIAFAKLFSAVRFADWFDRPAEPSDKSLGYFTASAPRTPSLLTFG